MTEDRSSPGISPRVLRPRVPPFSRPVAPQRDDGSVLTPRSDAVGATRAVRAPLRSLRRETAATSIPDFRRDDGAVPGTHTSGAVVAAQSVAVAEDLPSIADFLAPADRAGAGGEISAPPAEFHAVAPVEVKKPEENRATRDLASAASSEITSASAYARSPSEEGLRERSGSAGSRDIGVTDASSGATASDALARPGIESRSAEEWPDDVWLPTSAGTTVANSQAEPAGAEQEAEDAADVYGAGLDDSELASSTEALGEFLALYKATSDIDGESSDGQSVSAGAAVPASCDGTAKDGRAPVAESALRLASALESLALRIRSGELATADVTWNEELGEIGALAGAFAAVTRAAR